MGLLPFPSDLGLRGAYAEPTRSLRGAYAEPTRDLEAFWGPGAAKGGLQLTKWINNIKNVYFYAMFSSEIDKAYQNKCTPYTENIFDIFRQYANNKVNASLKSLQGGF